MSTFLRHGYVSAWRKYLCPGIHAALMATKSLAAYALNTKEATPKGPPPPKKKPVWHRREQSRSTTSSFWRERALAGIAHRQGKHNM
eukprot:10937775-Ditylum_brightwellii.AAC.1